MSSESISVESVWKSFSNETVLQDIDLTVADGEFCVLVGPSGCGKSTLLKSIAGLVDFNAGTIRIRGTNVDELSVQERDIGYVFQEFEETLFPHKSVADNVAFGLHQQDNEYSDDEIEDRIDEMLELLTISETRDNLPSELSGGQQQRVELARQFVRECDIMLLDDPLADLDYKLQKRMELEIRRLHRDLGSTFLYVTHNQNQALKLADRIVVMNQGMIEQVGTAEEVYNDPATGFVGRFIGDSTPFVGRVVETDGEQVQTKTSIGNLEARANGGEPTAGDRSLILVRPEKIRIGDETADNTVTATFEGRTFTGEITEFALSHEEIDYDIQVVEPGEADIGEVGESVEIGWDAEDTIYFDKLSVIETISLDDLIEV